MRPIFFIPANVLGALTFVAIPAGAAELSGPPTLMLITPQEAEELRLSLDDLQSSASRPGTVRGPRGTERPAPLGPRVVLRQPPVRETPDELIIETPSTTSLYVVFEENRAPVDMQTLEVRARKGIFSVSLTDRLKPHIHGTTLRAEAVTLPEGRFLVQIEIADVAGMRTAETYRLDVRGP